MNNREEAYGVLINTLLEKHDLRNDMNMNRYGKTSDEVIIKNLLIMCPDIDYELSRGKELIITYGTVDILEIKKFL